MGSVAAGKADAAGAAVEAESWLGGPDSDDEQVVDQAVVPKVTDDMLPNFHRWRRTFPELQLLVDNFEVIQEEAMKVRNHRHWRRMNDVSPPSSPHPHPLVPYTPPSAHRRTLCSLPGCEHQLEGLAGGALLGRRQRRLEGVSLPPLLPRERPIAKEVDRVNCGSLPEYGVSAAPAPLAPHGAFLAAWPQRTHLGPPRLGRPGEPRAPLPLGLLGADGRYVCGVG